MPNPGGRPKKPYHRVKHGTQAGYQWHYRNDTDICDACREAHREFNKDQYNRRKRLRNAMRNILYRGHKDPPSDAEMDEMVMEVRKFIENYVHLPKIKYQEPPPDEDTPERDHNIQRLPEKAPLPVYPRPRPEGRKFNPPPDARVSRGRNRRP